MRWILAVLFLVTACQSKTAKNQAWRAPSAGSEKVSNAPAPQPKEVFVLVDFGPRRPQEIELGVVNSGIKTCLLSFMAEGKAPTAVSFEGKIDHRGELQLLDFEGSEKPLVDCMKTASATVKLGRGKIGPFKMSIATGPDLIKGSKGMLIAPSEVKKFE